MILSHKQQNTIDLNFLSIIIYTLLISILSILFLEINWYLLFFPLLILILFIYGESTFIFLTIISLLVITSTLSIELRAIVQVVSIITLFYLFIKEYGLNFALYPKIPKQVSALIILLYLSMIISTVFSEHILLGCEEIERLTIFFLIVYSFFGFLKKSTNLKLYLISLLVVGIIYLGNVVYNFAQNDFSLIELNINELLKVEGNYINVNSIGSFFIIIISLLLSYYFIFKDKKRKIFTLGFLIFFILGLIITNSRAAILSTLVSSLFLIYFYNRKVVFYTIFFLLLLIPILFIQPFNSYVDLYFRLDRLTTGRNWIWETVSNIVQNNSIWGAGPAATKFEIYKNLPFMLGSPAEKYMLHHYNQIEFGHAHNFYLFFLTDLGILGFITSIFLPYTFISLCVKTLKKFKNINNEYYWLTLGILAAGAGLFIRGFFEWGNLISYGTIESDLPFWLIFVILTYLYQTNKWGNSELKINSPYNFI